MNNRKTALASGLAIAVVITAFAALGFSPIATMNSAIAQTSTAATLTLSPTSGPAGSTVTATGTGFTPSAAITLRMGSTVLATTPASVVADSAGGFTATFTVPATSTGAQTVMASDTSHTALATFTTGTTTSSTTTTTTTAATNTTAATLTLSPTSGPAGSTVTATGTGFLANSIVTLRMGSTVLATTPASVVSSATGGFTATFTVPSNATGAVTVTASDNVHTAIATFTTTAATTTTTSAVSSGTNIVQKGTIASHSGSSNATILGPTAGTVYTGIISYTASKPVELYILHAYPIASTQALNSSFGSLFTVRGSDGNMYAVTVISSSMSSNSQSGSLVFSGNGLMLHSTGGTPFLAAYSLKATADTPNVINDFSSAILATTTSSITTTSSSTTSTAATNTTSSASISASAGSVSGTITVTGQGFAPNTQVTTTINNDNSTATTTETTTSGTFTSSLVMPTSTAGTALQLKTTDASSGQSATTTFTVP